MNIPIYGFKSQKVWTAAELLGDDKPAAGSENALRDTLRFMGNQRKGVGNG